MQRPCRAILTVIVLAWAACTRSAQGQSPAVSPPGSGVDRVWPDGQEPTGGPFYPSSSGLQSDMWDPYVASPAPAGDTIGWQGPNIFTQPNYGLYASHGYSSWHGVSDGSGGNNNGFLFDINFASRLGPLSDATGVGAQFGAGYGLYDVNGRSSGFSDNEVQQQAFFTLGLFRRADPGGRWSGGVVVDAMLNSNFGQFATNPFLSQLRAQLAFALNDSHEIGMWTALRLSQSTVYPAGPVSFRGVDQFNFFWRHRFAFGGEAISWIGFPDFSKLGGNGSLGGYIFGGTLTAPLATWLAAYFDLQYMPPTASAGAAAAREETFYIAVGLVFYPRFNSHRSACDGPSWMPYLPVATNGSFLVDTSRTF